jgi:hypothetical protein
LRDGREQGREWFTAENLDVALMDGAPHESFGRYYDARITGIGEQDVRSCTEEPVGNLLFLTDPDGRGQRVHALWEEKAVTGTTDLDRGVRAKGFIEADLN